MKVYANGVEQKVLEKKGSFELAANSDVETITVVGTIGTERRLTAKDAISLTVGTDVELTAENSITDTQQIKEFDETCLDPGSVESISGEAVCIDDSAKDARFTFDVEVTPGLNQKQEYWYQFESDDFSQLNVGDVKVYANGVEQKVLEKKGSFELAANSDVETITVVGTIGTERRLTAKDAISLTVGTDVELTVENSITDTQQIKSLMRRVWIQDRSRVLVEKRFVLMTARRTQDLRSM